MKKKCLMMAVVAGVMAMMVSGCGTKEPTDADRAQNVIDAYKTNDVEAMKQYFETDKRFVYYVDALDDTGATGMKEVYQKVYELTKNAEFTIAEESKEDNSNDFINVTIKTVDFTDAIHEEMEAAAQEGADAFADVPTWMMRALSTGGTPVEKEVELCVNSDGTVDDSFSGEFLDVLTGGFYDFIPTTMTTCTSEDGYKECMLSFFDNIKYTYDEFEVSFEGEEFSDEDVAYMIDEVTKEYNNVMGIVASGECVEDGIRISIFIDYGKASTFKLEELGFITEDGVGPVSLQVTVDQYASEGVECETTDFGSGVLDEK